MMTTIVKHTVVVAALLTTVDCFSAYRPFGVSSTAFKMSSKPNIDVVSKPDKDFLEKKG
jgi:hypothetical protein